MTPDAPPPPPSLLAAVNQFIKRQPRPIVIAAGFALVGLMALLDYLLTGRGIAWAIYYAIPVLGLAWFTGWLPSLAAALVSALLNLAIDLALAHRLPNPIWTHVGSGLTLIIVLILARGTATVQMLLDYAQRGEVWKAMLKPRRLGGRFVAVPEWLRDSYTQDIAIQPSDIPILINAGKAFGTGTHQTTQMCVAMLETYLQPGDRVFDIGCGTGVLSLVAAKLGAAFVLAVDVEPEAVRATQENAELNQVTAVLQASLGSLELALNSSDGAQQFDVTVANLLAHIVVDLLQQGLARSLAQDGTLILSGIRDEQTGDVLAALANAGLDIIEKRQHDEWIAFAVRRPTGT